MTRIQQRLRPAWPACGFAAWAAAWLGGHASADDVVDELTGYADHHLLDDHLLDDSADISHSGAPGLELLSLVRGACSLSVRTPIAGHPQGLPPDPATRSALDAGQVMLVEHRDSGDRPLALIPRRRGDICRWEIRRYSTDVQMISSDDLGEMESALRTSVSGAAELLGRQPGVRGSRPVADLRHVITELTASNLVHLPAHDRPRVDRLLHSAAHVEAIVDVAGGAPELGHSGPQLAASDDQLRRLLLQSRSARAAAINHLIAEILPLSR